MELLYFLLSSFLLHRYFYLKELMIERKSFNLPTTAWRSQRQAEKKTWKTILIFVQISEFIIRNISVLEIGLSSHRSPSGFITGNELQDLFFDRAAKTQWPGKRENFYWPNLGFFSSTLMLLLLLLLLSSLCSNSLIYIFLAM
jgi:hypothetical protein